MSTSAMLLGRIFSESDEDNNIDTQQFIVYQADYAAANVNNWQDADQLAAGSLTDFSGRVDILECTDVAAFASGDDSLTAFATGTDKKEGFLA